MGDDAAQRADGRLQLLQRRRIFFGDDQVDLLRQRFHRVFETDQILGRRQTTQRVADFLQSTLDSGQHTQIDAGSGRAGLIEPLCQHLHLGFERLDGLARQRLRELLADFRKVLAEGFDDVFKLARRPQRFDSRRDVTQLLFEIADIDGRLRDTLPGSGQRRRCCSNHRLRGRRRRDRSHGGDRGDRRDGSNAASRGIAVKLALALGNLGDGAVDR